MRNALIVVLLAACGGGSKNVASGGAGHAETSCDQVAAKVVASLAAQLGAEEDEHLHKIVVERCTTDHWDEESRHCMATAGPHEDVHACSERLTPEQREALDRDAATVKVKPKGIGGGSTGSPPPPPPPTGKDGKDPCEGGE